MKILIGCPTSEHKSYCLKEYIEAVKKLNCDVLLVDNSECEEYYNKIKSLGVNVIKDRYYKKARNRIVSSRNLLKEHCLKNGYDYLFSLEQDVIPPLDVIERLLKLNKGPADDQLLKYIFDGLIRANRDIQELGVRS